MGIRDALNKNPLIVVGLVVVLVIVAIWAVSSSTSGPEGVPETYYTIDEGKTWFGLDTQEAPPFAHDGGQAVRAHLYKCGDGEPFVGFLEQYSADAKAVLKEAEEMANRGEKPNIQKIQAAGTQGRQVKKPGDNAWVSAGSPAGTNVQMVKCPDGSLALRAD